jgi:acetylserotonin N-methyltransferase
MIDPTPVIEGIYAFRRSKAMFAAVAMGVFDRLEEQPAEAAAFPGNRDAVERLLDTCAAMGFLRKRGALYENTAIASEYLRRGSPRTLAGYILYSNAALYPMWGHLEQAVETGENRWAATFGFGAAELFEHYFRTEESKRTFIAGMHGFGLLSSPRVVSAFDLGRFKRLVDLGGATGHLALAAVERYAGLKAAVFDLPRVIELAREYAGERVELIAGDFFNDELPAADLYALGRILHDWTEPKIEGLLSRIHAALPEGGAILIAETLLDDDKSGPLDSLLQSLNMLVCTEGKERTAGEYRELLERAGFGGVEAKRTGGALDAVMGWKG